MFGNSVVRCVGKQFASMYLDNTLLRHSSSVRFFVFKSLCEHKMRIVPAHRQTYELLYVQYQDIHGSILRDMQQVIYLSPGTTVHTVYGSFHFSTSMKNYKGAVEAFKDKVNYSMERSVEVVEFSMSSHELPQAFTSFHILPISFRFFPTRIPEFRK